MARCYLVTDTGVRFLERKSVGRVTVELQRLEQPVEQVRGNE